MFIAIGVEKGAVYIEGKTKIPTEDGGEKLIENWDDVPRGELASVSLTDNFGMTYTLSGCKEYSVYREAKTSIGSGAGVGVKAPYTQVLVGVRDFTPEIKSIREAANAIRATLKENSGPIVTNGLAVLKRVEDGLIEEYRNTTSQVVRLGFNYEYAKDHKQSAKGFRAGVPATRRTQSTEELKTELVRRLERFSKHG